MLGSIPNEQTQLSSPINRDHAEAPTAWSWTLYERQLLSQCLAGAVVHGIQIGDAGITADWLDGQIAARDDVLDRIEDGEMCATTGMTADERAFLG